jgi:hypothetical protein
MTDLKNQGLRQLDLLTQNTEIAPDIQTYSQFRVLIKKCTRFDPELGRAAQETLSDLIHGCYALRAIHRPQSEIDAYAAQTYQEASRWAGNIIEQAMEGDD